MPPHVASPRRLLDAELARRRRDLVQDQLAVDCEGARHHVRFDGRNWYADDHDEAAEAALQALGGAKPPCIRMVESIAEATPAELWSTFDARMPTAPILPVLRTIPADVRAVLLASGLADEFADASAPVRDAVAQLCLAVLGDGPVAVDVLRTKFLLTREFPHWDPGPGPWSDKELVLLARCMRAAAGEDRPHLILLPSDPLARRAVAKYAVGLLDHERFLTVNDLRAALSATHRNLKALTSLLISEGLLVGGDGQYRVRVRAPARHTGRRR